MPKLTKSQIRKIRAQAKAAREAEALEQGAENLKKERKDNLGFTAEERKELRNKKQEMKPKPLPKITWNYDVGDLVYLPDGISVGMISKNNAIDVEISNHSVDMKDTMKKNKYAGKIFVITSAGNDWYYPNQLRRLEENS